MARSAGGILSVLLHLLAKRRRITNRILIQGVKGSKGPFQMREGLALHLDNGGFTKGAEAVLREGVRLELHAPGPHVPERAP